MTTGIKRPSARRASTRLVGVALLIAVTLAACAQDDRGATATDDQERAVQFAQCMRDNGVPAFPDPGAGGEFGGVEHEQQDDPEFRAAQEACRDLAPGGEHQNTGDPEFVEQMRDFAQCMRDNGVPDFPDPDAEGRFRGRGHEQQDDPTYQAASETCREKLPGGGEH